MAKINSIEQLLIILALILIIALLFSECVRTWWKLLRSNLKCDFGIPLFGSHWREIFHIETYHDTLKRLYYKYPGERFVVLHEIGGRPEYLIRDPELVRQIAVRDFSSFVDRIGDVHAQTDPIIGNELTNLKTDDWRRIRNVLTSLLSGQKLKQIVIPSLDESKRDLIEYLCDELKMNDNNALTIDMMDLSTRSVVDGFCLAAFGLKTDSLRQHGNDYGFVEFTKSILKHSDSMSRTVYWAIIWFPRIMKHVFGRSHIRNEENAFFIKTCNDIADKRIAQNINRSDYLQLLQRLRDKSLEHDKNAPSKIAHFVAIFFPH